MCVSVSSGVHGGVGGVFTMQVQGSKQVFRLGSKQPYLSLQPLGCFVFVFSQNLTVCNPGWPPSHALHTGLENPLSQPSRCWDSPSCFSLSLPVFSFSVPLPAFVTPQVCFCASLGFFPVTVSPVSVDSGELKAHTFVRTHSWGSAATVHQ